MNDAFISHRNIAEDVEFTERLQRELLHYDLRVWYDRIGLKPGEAWEKRILNELNHSNSVIFVISPDFIESEWCRRELMLARALGKVIFPIQLKELIPSQVAKYRVEYALLQSLQMIIRPDPIKAVKEIARELRDIIILQQEICTAHTLIVAGLAYWKLKPDDAYRLLQGSELRRVLLEQPKLENPPVDGKRFPILQPEQSDFLRKSIELKDQIEADRRLVEEQRHQLEIRNRDLEEVNGQLVVTRRQRTTLLLSAILIISILSGLIIVRQNADLQQRQSLIDAGRARERLGDDQVAEAIEIALTAVKIDQPPLQSQAALYAAAYAPGLSQAVLENHPSSSLVANNNLLAWGEGSRLVTWSAVPYTPVRADYLPDSTDSVVSVAISRSVDRVAVAQESGCISVWDPNSRNNPVYRVKLTDAIPSEIALNSTGTLLVIGTRTGQISLVEISSRPPMQISQQAETTCPSVGATADIPALSIYNEAITTIHFSPDDSFFLTTASERVRPDQNPADLWVRGEDGWRIDESAHFLTPATVNSTVIEDNDSRILLGLLDNTIMVWNRRTHRSYFLLGHQDTVSGVAFVPASPYALSSSADQTLILWQLDDDQGTLVNHLGESAQSSSNTPLFLALAPSGHYAFTGSISANLVRWSIDEPSLLARATIDSEAVRNIQVAAENHSRIVALSSDGTLSSWLLNQNNEMSLDSSCPFDLAGERALAFDYSEQQEQALIAIEGQGIAVWTMGTQGCGTRSSWPQSTAFAHSAPVTVVEFAGDSSLAATGDEQGNIILWDISRVEAGQARFPAPEATAGITSLEFNADESQLLATYVDGSIWLWDIAEQSSRQIAPPNRDLRVNRAVFSRDGSQIFAAQGGRISVWGRSSDQWTYLSTTDSGHLETIEDLALSDDGSRLITASRDKTLILWDVPTWTQLYQYRYRLAEIRAVGFLSGSERVIAGSSDGVLTLWRTDTLQNLRTFASWRLSS